jgi:type IV pilus assembly protein PilQ
LQAALEKSEAIPGAVTTVVNRNQTQTDVLLFNGEETVIGGLFDVEHVTYIRRMPILGRIPLIKYLFSSRNTRDVHREMIVIVKAEIIPPARERLHERERLRDSFQRLRLDFDDVREEVFGN